MHAWKPWWSSKSRTTTTQTLATHLWCRHREQARSGSGRARNSTYPADYTERARADSSQSSAKQPTARLWWTGVLKMNNRSRAVTAQHHTHTLKRSSSNHQASRTQKAATQTVGTQTPTPTTDSGALQQWRSMQSSHRLELQRLQHRISFIIQDMTNIGFAAVGYCATQVQRFQSRIDLTVQDMGMKHVDLGEPTPFLEHVYLGCTQRECKPNEGMAGEANTGKCSKREFLQEQLKSYLNRRKGVQTLRRGLAKWKDLRRNA